MSYTDYNISICLDGETIAEGDLNSIHLKFCKHQVWGEVCEYPEVSSFLNSYLVLELVYVLASCSIKKIRGIAMVTTLSLHQQNAMVSALNVLLLTLNKALPGGRPRITRYNSYLSLFE